MQMLSNEWHIKDILHAFVSRCFLEGTRRKKRRLIMLQALQNWIQSSDQQSRADAGDVKYHEIAVVDDEGREVVAFNGAGSNMLTLSKHAEVIELATLRNLPLQTCRDLFRNVRFLKQEDFEDQDGQRSCVLAIVVSYPPVLEAALGDVRLSCCESENYELNLDAAKNDECTEFLNQSRTFNRKNLADYLVCLGKLLCHLTLRGGADSSDSPKSYSWGRFESPRYTDKSWGRYLSIVVNDDRVARNKPHRVSFMMYGLPVLYVKVGDTTASLTKESLEKLNKNHERSFLLLQTFFSLPMTLLSASAKKYVFFASHPQLPATQVSLDNRPLGAPAYAE